MLPYVTAIVVFSSFLFSFLTTVNSLAMILLTIKPLGLAEILTHNGLVASLLSK